MSKRFFVILDVSLIYLCAGIAHEWTSVAYGTPIGWIIGVATQLGNEYLDATTACGIKIVFNYSNVGKR
jgi:hypothetical protein